MDKPPSQRKIISDRIAADNTRVSPSSYKPSRLDDVNQKIAKAHPIARVILESGKPSVANIARKEAADSDYEERVAREKLALPEYKRKKR